MRVNDCHYVNLRHLSLEKETLHRKDKTHSYVHFSTPLEHTVFFYHSGSLGMIQRYAAVAAAVNGKSMCLLDLLIVNDIMQSIWNLDA